MIIDPISILIGGLLFVTLILISWIIMLERRIKRLTAGRQIASLEDIIGDMGEDVERIMLAWQKAEERFTHIDERLKKQISHVKTVRFNPFADQGSNQSFATAIVNDHGDGVVISSLYARDKMSVYSKPVKGHSSEYDLTAEEIEALTR